MKKVLVVVATLLALACLAYVLSFYLPVPARRVKYAVGGKRVLVSHEFYQGIAYYGGYWYFSGREYLAKVAELGSRSLSAENRTPIPYDLVLAGYNHIGDIDVENGLVYAPLEDVKYEKPLVAVYDAETLDFLYTIGPLPQSHMPWCAVDPQRGLIYTSEFDNVDRVLVYDMKGNKVREILLNTTLQRVQGGDLENGYLYLTTDDGGDWIYVVDLSTGGVRRLARVDTPYEMEGVEVVGNKLYALVGTPFPLKNIVFIYTLVRGPP